MRLLIADPRESPERFVAELKEIVREYDFAALLAGGECSLLPISEQRETLSSHVRLGLPDHDAVQRSLDKIVLLEAAAAAGLDPPPSRVCEEAEEGRRAVRELGLPIVVKPCRSVLPSERGFRQQPISVVTRQYELEGALARGSTPYIVQRLEEHVPRLSCAGLMTTGGVVGLVVVRFLRTWPPQAGAVCFGETVPAPRGLVERVESLLETVGWCGIFELELLDLGRGRLAAIDLNPRIFGWLALAIASGVDLPLLWLESLAGRDPKARQPLVGVQYRWEDAELAHFAWQLRRGRLRAAAPVARPRRRVVHAHFRLRDPGPLVGRLVELARYRGRLR
jgi:predicted ATP-grasp superfamily ATP-dependent carboligase